MSGLPSTVDQVSSGSISSLLGISVNATPIRYYEPLASFHLGLPSGSPFLNSYCYIFLFILLVLWTSLVSFPIADSASPVFPSPSACPPRCLHPSVSHDYFVPLSNLDLSIHTLTFFLNFVCPVNCIVGILIYICVYMYIYTSDIYVYMYIHIYFLS